jgi:Uma2 family endonuclease
MSKVAPTERRTSSRPPIYRLSVDEYERLAGTAVLDDPQVELIDGYLVKKMPKYPPHIWVVDLLVEMLRAMLPGFWCRKEDPVRIPQFDEPEPDISIARGSRNDYRSRIPEPRDIALLVEVAETTLDRDQGPKLDAYAHGRIPVYWIVNLVDRRVEVYSDPNGDGYSTRRDFVAGQEVPVVIDGIEVGTVAVDAILP